MYFYGHSHVEKILQQIEEFHPKYVCMTDPDAAAKLDAALSGRAGAPKLLTGPEGLRQLAALDGPDVVLNSVVGIAGLGASLTAIESGHDLALANKESQRTVIFYISMIQRSLRLQSAMNFTMS